MQLFTPKIHLHYILILKNREKIYFLLLFLKKNPIFWQIGALNPPFPALKASLVAEASWEKDLAQGHLRQALWHMHRDWLIKLDREGHLSPRSRRGEEGE